PLPLASHDGFVAHDGARIWHASYGAGTPVILPHGGLGHSGNWGYQIPALVANGYRAIVIDSRGHGRSTRDSRAYTYEPMAADVRAVMDALRVDKAALIGWSDGATIALILALTNATRVNAVFFFGCNMDPSGVHPMPEPSAVITRVFGRHRQDYARLSATPERFDAFAAAVGVMMETQPNYSSADLARVGVPVRIVHSVHDEFIKREHAEYLARTIPRAELVVLEGVSHFAPLQGPEQFNGAVLDFLKNVVL
ncbi:MAG: alpha/beta hydrolase, partial [Candidatus Eremiobacteraeota bacterium]|nr:alpha/beta hydrolase [Candidatus Eremiobacteraeota bacterium]